MLLNFTVSNWMSYRDEMSLNMIASLERQHGETLAKLPGFRSKKALPIVSIYGGNASGKTNIFRAIAMLKRMIVSNFDIDDALPINPFRLETDFMSKPTMFDITFLINDSIYRYVLEATLDGISYESLEKISEKRRVDIFERREEDPEAPYIFNKKFFDVSKHFKYVAQSTRKNQTFLGNAAAHKVTELCEAYSWFADTLQLVGAWSQAWSFAITATSRDGFLNYAGDMLSRLDTGIEGLEAERVDPDFLLRNGMFRKRVKELREGQLTTMVMESDRSDYEFEMFIAHVDNGSLVVERMKTLHVGPDGKHYNLELGIESAGTRRLMGLLPVLFELQDEGGFVGSRVYVVDELDRCLHTMLTTRLIEGFLAGCDSTTRKQLLFSTHDLLLMDQSLMRRDEMYITQRREDGCSELIGLAEYEGIRHDKDLIRSYLDGRFGGVPMLREANNCG